MLDVGVLEAAEEANEMVLHLVSYSWRNYQWLIDRICLIARE
jgi:hypothetical protein